jgi:hypothetical protein
MTIFSFSNISDPNAGSKGTIVIGINASGEVAGNYYDSGGTERGFTHRNGSFTDISDPNAGGKDTIVAGINASGEVAGNYYDSSGTEHGFTYSSGSFTDISDPNAGSKGTMVIGINASGEVAGNYYDSSGTERGFTYSNGSFTDFSNLHGAPPLALSHNGIVAGINDFGEVAGYYSFIFPHHDATGFIDSNGSFSYFDTPSGPSFSWYVTAINNSGEVIGNIDGTFAAGSFFPPHGFIYINGTSTSLVDPGAGFDSNDPSTRKSGPLSPR